MVFAYHSLKLKVRVRFYIQKFEKTFTAAMFDTTLIIKLALMAAFFFEVLIFGKFISSCSCFREGNLMSYAMTFSGALFMSIAFLDIIPEAISNFD